MFYKMIQKKRDEWFVSTECTVASIIDYIVNNGEMRDAQLEAIKTYLYLKIACDNKPLNTLIKEGKFNSLDLDDLELSGRTRNYLKENPAAASLLEYAGQTNDAGEVVSSKLYEQIKKNPESIDYDRVIDDIFYGVGYTDYLFSLPMGAGKTYLMAAFIYLDLYFAMNEPENKVFAHNFIIFAPSGLKSSVVPSLKTIQRFNPSWILPEPTASDIKRCIAFEVLDQSKTANKSNKTKNPNVQKIANHQPLEGLFGLVAVTNAEKVILDRLQFDQKQMSIFEDSDDEKDRQANELRNLIGKLPNLSVFIDEVHHAVSDEIKLRAVVNKWTENKTVNSVIGFSGTPYLEKAEKVKVTEKLFISTDEISNIVYYYPLVDGIGNFLKRPVVKIANITESLAIVEEGVREFLNLYKDTKYEGGLTAKLAVYCGTIEKLEEAIYPLVSRVVVEYGLTPECILKFHKGNKVYPQPLDSQLQFDSLDKSISKVRIILLVQIGKEGWDCQSLTGIILSQEGDCPTNMVLQTSCRCLRQVVKGEPESSLIYLNSFNAGKLQEQLMKQHRITMKEFESGKSDYITLKRYDRTKYLKLPKVDFFQLRISYEDLIIEEADPNKRIKNAIDNSEKNRGTIETTDFNMLKETVTIDFYNEKHDEYPITLHKWLIGIAKSSAGTLSYAELLPYKKELKTIFSKITIKEDEKYYISPQYDVRVVNANIRKAFADLRDYDTKEELVPEKTSLLNIKNFTDEVLTTDARDYYPEQITVENIIKDDNGKLKPSPDIEKAIKMMKETGNEDMAKQLQRQVSSHPQKNRSFHYLPYRTDSGFEQEFLSEVLSFNEIDSLDLEVYYNGDRALTEFKIKCFKKQNKKWVYIGMYTPDFLIIKREGGEIKKVVIVETKGHIYASDPMFLDKRKFMEKEFSAQNNKAFGYEKFDYLYLEDSLSKEERIHKTHEKLREFFAW